MGMQFMSNLFFQHKFNTFKMLYLIVFLFTNKHLKNELN